MSNYTIAVNWSGKDALSDSDAAKVISGTDFNTEFSAVQTAVNTKANVNGSASEAFSATTASSATNTTQVATTQYVTAAVAAIPTPDLSAVYPVGAIFTTVTTYANSAAVVAAIGGTTWVAFAAGRMLLGVSGSHALNSTGGAETHTLTTSEIPAHTHAIPAIRWSNTNGFQDNGGSGTGTSNSFAPSTASTGDGDAHSIMNPYIAVYMWKRTA